ncbi:MAG: hypothetical protein MUE61_20730 [Vicinamibacterales bacterium]|jgi:hypothetical protein|nr:hypothetical protein [Vicinamibacterales bacterium]
MKTALVGVLFLAGAGAAGLRLAAAPADEPPPTFTAAQLLNQAQIKGPHHTVASAVQTEGYYHVFHVQSDFGAFDAAGRSLLAVRLREVEALAQLEEVSKTGVFLAAAGNSVLNLGKGVANVVTAPTETAKGLGSGVKRFGVNLGRQSKRAYDSTTNDDPAEASKQGDNAAVSAGKAVLGVNKAYRRWAQKLGVDPYTTNAVLRNALSSIAEIDAAGSIATKVVLPIPGVVGMTATVSGMVWSKDPEELRKINEQRLRELGVPDATAKTLFLNSAMTLSYETRLVAALHAVKLRGAADRVAAAADSRHEREALFHVESAELLQQRHAKAPFTALLADSVATVGVTARGQAWVLLPVDWLRWTSEADATWREIDARARKELDAKSLTIVLTGKASPAASKELAGRGWTMGPA